MKNSLYLLFGGLSKLKKNYQVNKLMLCDIAVCLNVIIGSVMTTLHFPLLYLDAIGTIFIAFIFELKYGLITGICTNLLLALLFGVLAIPFGLVSISIAFVASICSRGKLTYKKAIITGILIAAIGALVSAPIRLVLYGGFEGLTRTPSDLIVIAVKSSGKEMLVAAYWGAFVDSLFDKVISCLIVVWLCQLKPIRNYLNQYKKM